MFALAGERMTHEAIAAPLKAAQSGRRSPDRSSQPLDPLGERLRAPAERRGYVALGVTPEGTKGILGLWIETSEGAKFTMAPYTNSLRERNRTKLSNDESLIHFPAAPETVNVRAVAMLTASRRS
jgi:hypothetical protein